ncbi:MAG: response regulator [Chloroflexi bacterium]|nr:response regulator [Chloroflexota bacterium]MYD48284.1 response regulator [Chloroflexota bacterium]
MNRDQLLRENEALRDRLSRLSEASLRIIQDLDFNSVLQEVLDSARSLTGARYGVIVLHDTSGNAEDFLSSGMTADESARLWTMPGWPEHFQYLSRLPGPLRIPDLLGHIRSLGLRELEPTVEVSPRVAFLGAPVLHLGQRVGSVFLAEKQGGPEFTREDEETLALFATHAAMAIANARRYREERQTKADLETLIDTSPVGVVVLDAGTCAPKSLNREVQRIVDGLRDPEQTTEQLLEVVSFRRADGREFSFTEFPLTHALSSGETVRAEEIVISVPDGRSVTTLINATPIASEEGAIETVVVTMQDLTPLEEVERQRAEFLGTVSHELRGPLTSIKGSAAALLRTPSTLDAAEIQQFLRIIDSQTDHILDLIGELLDAARIESGTLSVSPEPSDPTLLVDRAVGLFQSSGDRTNVRIDLPPDLPRVLADRRRIEQVLSNLLTNAARYSPESSIIRVSAALEDVHVAISVADDGVGVSPEQLPYLFRRFFRAEGDEADGVGAGLGLAVCKGIVEAHGGRIWAESDGPGRGARFTFTLPAAEPVGGAAVRSGRSARQEVRVLAVDDDAQALWFVRDALTEGGYQVTATVDPEETLGLMERDRPHLVLLDLVLPGTDGVELMQNILRIADVPVLFLSGYGQDQVIARAFEMGADDYIVKPFSPTELTARVRAALRRRTVLARVTPSQPYVRGDLTIDYEQRKVNVAGEPVRLTAIEYDLLRELSVNAGRVLTHRDLLQRVWGQTKPGGPQVIRTHLTRLRGKLGEDGENPKYIFAEPRVGYRMERPDAKAQGHQ